MYSELLRAALDGGAVHGDEHVTAGELLGALLVARGHLTEASADPGRSVDGQIADELAYDVALARICQSLGIPVDVNAFTQPARERCRLEGALSSKDIDVNRVTGRR